jgi:hypothetical protein
MEPKTIKQELAEETDFPNSPEGLLAELKVEIPNGFNRAEWLQLTEVIITACYHSLY